MRSILKNLVEPILSRMDAAVRSDKGQTLVEYALIISFVAIALVGVLISYEGGVSSYYDVIIGMVDALV